MSDRQAILDGLRDLSQRIASDAARFQAGLDALAALPEATRGPEPDAAQLFEIIRRYTGAIKDQAFVNELDAWRTGKPIPRQRTLTDSDFVAAAARLGCSIAQIRAVDEVESAGGGLEPGRAEIIALDGPGGFIDGDLPKILFEAHKFSKHTGGRFDKLNPTVSSPVWNRKLYKGGQAEWARLYAAMQLDREAALKSASWGRYQILGENFRLAGFANVEDFVAAMKRDERAHLDAFCSYVEKAGLLEELRRISTVHKDCEPFAAGYNGPAFQAGDYDGKLARAFKRWS